MNLEKRFCFKYFSILEFHEIISVFMILGLALLYAFKLHKWIFEVIPLIGSITKMFFVCLLALALICLFLPKRPIRDQARFILRIMTSFFVMLLTFELITNYIRFRDLTLLDELLQQWDQAVFGGKIAPLWFDPLYSMELTLIFSGVYLVWFILIYSTVFLLLFKGREAVLEYTSKTLLTFYIGYIIYIFVPAIGPLYTYSFAQDIGGLTTFLLNPKWINPAADVFPSLHTGIAVVMLMQIWRSYRIWTILYGPVCFLIVLSTLYLRIHYGVDVIAGITLAVLISKAAPILRNYWNRFRSQDKVKTSTHHFQA